MASRFSRPDVNAMRSPDPTLAWIGDRLPDRIDWHPEAKAKSIEQDGKTIAAWAYCPGGDGSWDISFAVERRYSWETPETLASMLGCPFEQWGASKLVTIIAEDNRACISLTKRLGFVLEETVPNYWPGGRAGLLYALHPPQKTR